MPKIRPSGTSLLGVGESLNNLCDAHPFQSSWYLKNLVTGEETDRDGHFVVTSASTRKIAILAAALKAIRDGRFTLDQPVTIDAKHQNNTSGVFQHLQPGFTIQFRDALTMMIIVSDNTCTGTVVDMIGLEEINTFCRSIGMKGTIHRFGIPPNNLPRNHAIEDTNTTTPKDVGMLLAMILEGASTENAAARLGSTSTLCKLAIDILKRQKLGNRLPSMLPQGTMVAHKTGTGARDCNDAGIIYLEDTPLFILTAYTQSEALELPDRTPYLYTATKLIGEMARTCYDWFSQE